MPLEIYKASAGSGKTFQIVREYLKMVFKRPMVYRNILAVTFTNKATAEMKDRILKELYLLSSGQPSGHMEILRNELNLSEAEIKIKALHILKLILHDYSRFSISTIDSLFQRVIRAFSKEMHLNPNYRTQIDTSEILEEAVNLLFIEMDQNEELRQWMLEYTEKNLQDGKKWNLTGELIKRGEELFQEEFKQFSGSLLEKIADKNYLTSYSLQLNELVAQYDQKLRLIGRKGLQLIAEHDLTTDQFKYGFAKHFDKLVSGNFEKPGSRVLNACNNCDLWYKPADNPGLKTRIQNVYSAGLNDLLVTSVEIINLEGVRINSANVILKNIFSFGLLTDIALKVNEISKERNVVLLNDSTSLLQKVINGSDSPFVYEKMGSVYRHFMLDEFQDTSRLQWCNLKPLVENSLSEGNISMVVGDVKQSIYRWRNGDWSILASQLKKDFGHHALHENPLKTNWRSSRKIIDFNNLVFRESSRILNSEFQNSLSDSIQQEESGIIQNLYAEHYQEFSQKVSPEGFIRVNFIQGEKELTKEEFRKAALGEMIHQLENLQEKRVKARDIAILIRGKSDSALVAEALLERKNTYPDSPFCYDFISNDSLLISQSPVVRFILNFFSLFVNAENTIVKADLIYSYIHVFGAKAAAEKANLHAVFDIHADLPEIFKKWFGEGETPIFDEELLSLPLYNLAVKIVNDFELQKSEGDLIYLDAFLDLILQFSKDEPGCVSAFLDWWELTGKDKTIGLAEGQDAITILTIHKAKGLEFHTVLIPFCDWEVVPSPQKELFLWCHPQTEPFNSLDLVLVKYGSELKESIFAEDYYREMLYTMVDNLNLLYVAFTRAAHNLIITCPYTAKLTKIKSVANLMQQVLENPPLLDSLDQDQYMNLLPFWDPEVKVLEFGSVSISETKQEKTENRELTSFRSNADPGRLKLRLHSEDYFNLDQNEIGERINTGKLLHQIFENISTSADVGRSLRRMVSEGKIGSETAREYEQIINSMLTPEPQHSWFSGEWRVLNERNILRGQETSHRPDRIMIKGNEIILIDYKTGEKHDRYKSQVKGYLQDFRKMGYENSRGYLWYLRDNELEEII